MSVDDSAHIDKEPLEESRASRLFQHAMHEDMLFNERLNFFAVFESLLLAAVATLFSATHVVATILALFFTLIGMIITIAWLCIQHNQLVMLRVLVDRSEFHVPEYKETRILARGPKRGVGSGKVLAYLVPSAVLSLWVAVAIALILLQWTSIGDSIAKPQPVDVPPATSVTSR